MIQCIAAVELSDAALEALGELPHLQVVAFPSAFGLTAVGVERLKAKRPHLHINSPLEHGGYQPSGLGWARGVRSAYRLVIPRGATRADFDRLMAGRDDWRAIRCESANLTDDWMPAIARCRDLEVFANAQFNPAGLSSRGMAMLARCPKLRFVEICSQQALAEDDFAAIARGCPDLEHIYVCDAGRAQIGNTGLAALRSCPQLKFLKLREIGPGFTDAGLTALAASCPDLATLEIDAGTSTVGDAGLAALAACPRLERLALPTGPDAGDAGLTALAEHNKTLNYLHLNGAARATDAGLQKLAEGLPKLGILRLTAARDIGDDGFRAVAGLNNLFTLALPRAENVTDAGLAALAGARCLDHLDLSSAKAVTDAGLASLAQCPYLRTLLLSSATGITDKGLEALGARGEWHQVDMNAAAAVTDAGVAALLRNSTSLHQLHLGAATDISDATLDALDKAPDLWRLNLSSARRLTAARVEQFTRQRPNLQFHRPFLLAPPTPRPALDEEVF